MSASASSSHGTSAGAGAPVHTASASAGKASTTSTLFLTSTMSVPNNDELCLGCATVLHCQMLQDSDSGRACPELYQHAFAMFNEDTYNATPKGGPAVAGIDEIFVYIKKIFDLAQFSPECTVLSLVFINRLVAFTKMPLTGKHWRLLMLSALLVAQKVWDDRALANVDFPAVYEHAASADHGKVDVKIINQLERKFLELIGYNVHVSSSLYAKYYFELRTLAEENNLAWRLEPLTAEQARKLEATSASKREELRAGRGHGLAAGGAGEAARSHTVGDLGAVSKARAVLS